MRKTEKAAAALVLSSLVFGTLNTPVQASRPGVRFSTSFANAAPAQLELDTLSMEVNLNTACLILQMYDALAGNLPAENASVIVQKAYAAGGLISTYPEIFTPDEAAWINSVAASINAKDPGFWYALIDLSVYRAPAPEPVPAPVPEPEPANGESADTEDSDPGQTEPEEESPTDPEKPEETDSKTPDESDKTDPDEEKDPGQTPGDSQPAEPSQTPLAPENNQTEIQQPAVEQTQPAELVKPEGEMAAAPAQSQTKPAEPAVPGFDKKVEAKPVSLSEPEQAVQASISAAQGSYFGSVSFQLIAPKENKKLKLKNLGEIMLLPDYENDSAWIKSISPYNTPRLWGQCTWFAWGRFYEIYGFSPQFYGNGNQCVDQLLRAHPDKFTRSAKPTSGAVFSGDSAHNHVGIVLEYDEEKDTMIIQEGNLDVVSNPIWEIALKDYRTIEVTPSQLCSMYGNVTYAVPNEEMRSVMQKKQDKLDAKKILREKAIARLKKSSALENSSAKSDSAGSFLQSLKNKLFH